MVREEEKEFLSVNNKKLIDKLNTLIGPEKYKVMSLRDLANILGCSNSTVASWTIGYMFKAFRILGCSNSTVARWLREENSLNVLYAYKICEILNLNKKEYLCFEELHNDNLYNEFFNKLNIVNKKKVLEYVDYLLYLQNKEEISLRLKK